MDQEEKSIPMGMGPMGDPSIIFPRQFRFLMTPENDPDIQYWTTKATVRYAAKTIESLIYERQDLATHNWILKMMQPDHTENMKLTALDASGNKLYILQFKGVKLIDHNVVYDYSKSDVVTHNVKFYYSEMVTL